MIWHYAASEHSRNYTPFLKIDNRVVKKPDNMEQGVKKSQHLCLRSSHTIFQPPSEKSCVLEGKYAQLPNKAAFRTIIQVWALPEKTPRQSSAFSRLEWDHRRGWLVEPGLHANPLGLFCSLRPLPHLSWRLCSFWESSVMEQIPQRKNTVIMCCSYLCMFTSCLSVCKDAHVCVCVCEKGWGNLHCMTWFLDIVSTRRIKYSVRSHKSTEGSRWRPYVSEINQWRCAGEL